MDETMLLLNRNISVRPGVGDVLPSVKKSGPFWPLFYKGFALRANGADRLAGEKLL